MREHLGHSALSVSHLPLCGNLELRDLASGIWYLHLRALHAFAMSGVAPIAKACRITHHATHAPPE